MTLETLSRLLLTFVLVGTLGAGEAVAQQCSAPYRAVTQRTDRARLDSNNEAVAQAFKLTNLSAVALPDGWRELRLRLFPGILMGEFHIRIVEHADSVCGEIRQFWSAARTIPAFARQTSCRDLEHTQLIDFCHLQSEGGIRWRSVLSYLDSVGVDTIPDAATWGLRLTADDDVTISVEVLRGDQFRTPVRARVRVRDP